MSNRLRLLALKHFFDLEPHQVRYMLDTFTQRSIAEGFLLHQAQVSTWRKWLEMPAATVGHRRKRQNSINGAAPASRYFG